LQDGAQSVLNNIIDVASSDKESRIENILDVNLIALEMFDQPILYQSLGINYMRVGNYEQAIQNLELALKQRSGLLPSHFHLKKCYRQQGDLAKAEFHEKKLEEYLARIAPAQSEAIRKGLVDL
jgi:tetratricopeptide (TPR) repeat protein